MIATGFVHRAILTFIPEVVSSISTAEAGSGIIICFAGDSDAV